MRAISRERRTARSIRQSNRDAKWQSVLGVGILLLPAAGLTALIVSVDNLPLELLPGIGLLGLIAIVPGVTYLVMGSWFRRKARQGEEVVQPKLKDYGVTALQLSPGLLLSAIGIFLPKFDPDLVEVLGPDYLNWLVLALATLLSVVVVRRVRDKP